MRTVYLPIMLVSLVMLAAAGVGIQGQSNGTPSLAGFLNDRLAAKYGSTDKPPTVADICKIDTDPLAARIFKEYGAMFAAADDVVIPVRCIYTSEAELLEFQNKLNTASARIGGVEIELQKAAMAALLNAISDAQRQKLSITPRGGKNAARRSFSDTKRLWESRFFPGLEHWASRGKISREDAKAAREMEIADQVWRVLQWESKGYFFSTGKNRTILSSVAAPGTSQHLSMLALDVAQFGDARVRAILNKHGWYQTVADDTPHFTYLGVEESELPTRGLQLAVKNGYKFWIPRVD